MAKIYCTTLGPLHTQSYQGVSGKKYEFHQGMSTVVEDPEDILHFLNAGQGEYFKIDAPAAEIKNIFDRVKKAVVEVIASRETAAKEAAQEEVKKEIIAALVDDHYGLTDEEYKEAMNDGTILEFRKIIEPGDNKKVRGALAAWAKDEFSIILHPKVQDLQAMTGEFWVSWKKISPEKIQVE